MSGEEQTNLIVALVFFAVVAIVVAVWTSSLTFSSRALLTGVVFAVLALVVKLREKSWPW